MPKLHVRDHAIWVETKHKPDENVWLGRPTVGQRRRLMLTGKLGERYELELEGTVQNWKVAANSDDNFTDLLSRELPDSGTYPCKENSFYVDAELLDSTPASPPSPEPPPPTPKTTATRREGHGRLRSWSLALFVVIVIAAVLRLVGVDPIQNIVCPVIVGLVTALIMKPQATAAPHPPTPEPQPESPDPPAVCKDRPRASVSMIYAPRINPNTFLHFSWDGDSCALRDFSVGGEPSPNRKWTTSAVVRLICQEEPFGQGAKRPSVDKVDEWRETTRRLNQTIPNRSVPRS
jgi:hypothetical protein